MPAQREGAVQIEVPEGWRLRRVDGPDHCATQAFKAVDFVVIPPDGDAWLAVEIKGGELPCNPHFQRQQYLAQLQSAPFLTHLVAKFRDTWLYLWLEDATRAARARDYLVLLVLPTDLRPLDQPLLLALTDHLRQRLPEGVPSRCGRRWQQALVRWVLVTTPEIWQESLGRARAKQQRHPWAEVKIALSPCSDA